MEVKTTNKWEAYEALINVVLRDPEMGAETAIVIENNKERRKVLYHATGASKTKELRIALSIPHDILRSLENYGRMHQEPFFTEQTDKDKAKKDMHTFMRKFPVFAVPSRI